MKIVAEELRVSFGGIEALGGVDFELCRGEIVGLIGPNGAGKTTLFNCVTGVVPARSGRVIIDGVDVTNLSVDRRVHMGVSRTFQTPRINMHGTVLEAVLLGFNSLARQSLLGSFFGSPGVRMEEAKLTREACELIEELGIATDPMKCAGELSLGVLRLVEVARSLAASPNYLLLDEPAAGIDVNDQALLSAVLRRAASRGIGVLIVEHNVPFVAKLCTRVAAVVQGKIVSAGTPDRVLSDPAFVKAYLGDSDAR